MPYHEYICHFASGVCAQGKNLERSKLNPTMNTLDYEDSRIDLILLMLDTSKRRHKANALVNYSVEMDLYSLLPFASPS